MESASVTFPVSYSTQRSPEVRIPCQAERLAVEVVRPLEIGHGHRDEVDALDLHQGVEPSGYGA